MSLGNRIQEFEQGIVYKSQFKNRECKKDSILEGMKKYRTSALSVAVVKDYKLEFIKAYGAKKRDGIEGIDENTLFQAASISKPVFAVAVMRLVERGILDLDEDVNKYLSSWKVPENDGWQPKITLRQILSHTAGTTVHGFGGYNVNDEIPSTIQVLDGVSPSNSETVKVDVIPGLKYRYSGGGFTIAQQVLVDVFRRPFYEIMKELVLEPLEMKNSTYEQPISFTHRNNIACGYGEAGDEVEGMYHIYPEMAAAGLWTTPSDLAKLGLELQHILNGKKDGILKVESVREMLKSQNDITSEVSMGIGFHLFKGKDENFSIFEHSGMNCGFESKFIFSTENGTGFIIMINSNEDMLLEEVTDTLEKIYGLDVESTKKVEVHKEEYINMNEYIGEYRNDKNVNINIKIKEEKVHLGIGDQEHIEFIRKPNNTFLSVQVNTELKFSIDEDLEKHLTLVQNNEEIRYRKIN